MCTIYCILNGSDALFNSNIFSINGSANNGIGKFNNIYIHTHLDCTHIFMHATNILAGKNNLYLKNILHESRYYEIKQF